MIEAVRKPPLFVAGVVVFAALVLGLVVPPLLPVAPAPQTLSEADGAAMGDIVVPLPAAPKLSAAKVALGERL
ncbi:MAG: hypothetical protein N2690_07700, partial [Rhodocyclaceae bacterium]|nr:hypothetical protein [Rhodocyclaceae bacterium]